MTATWLSRHHPERKSSPREVATGVFAWQQHPSKSSSSRGGGHSSSRVLPAACCTKDRLLPLSRPLRPTTMHREPSLCPLPHHPAQPLSRDSCNDWSTTEETHIVTTDLSAMAASLIRRKKKKKRETRETVVRAFSSTILCMCVKQYSEWRATISNCCARSLSYPCPDLV